MFLLLLIIFYKLELIKIGLIFYYCKKFVKKDLVYILGKFIIFDFICVNGIYFFSNNK